ncbi:hypothetical protein K488DRAFT_88716 [Vararia minispora EC-137]|uniref:Uncharacterized protein n=1 Tax=Vararia minispora EC-137 TaxID=1314806 RepID=A0ACB8QD12_9AGAM|nr:hypothetical protein K488DRAFT_88716 [Vararia minispora EC-137]
MPIASSKGAPHFKGKRVNSFLQSLKECAERAGKTLDEVVHYIPRYCSDEVRYAIENLAPFQKGTGSWADAKLLLLDMFDAIDKPPTVSMQTLQNLVSKTARTASVEFRTLADTQQYYRRFLTMSSQLRKSGELSGKETNRLFLSGIPPGTRRRIRPMVEPSKQKLSSPPEVAEVMGYLRRLFDDDGFEAMPSMDENKYLVIPEIDTDISSSPRRKNSGYL